MAKNKKSKKEEAVVTEVPTVEDVVQETLAQSEAIIEAAQPMASLMVIEPGLKIGGITKENYKANLARANELKERLVNHLEETGGFPSHRYIQKIWGYNISLKAIIRHKTRILQAQNIDPEYVKTTDQLPRSKKTQTTEVPA